MKSKTAFIGEGPVGKRIGIFLEEAKDLYQLIPYVRQFGEPVVVVDNYQPVDLMLYFNNSEAPNLSNSGTTSLRTTRGLEIQAEARRENVPSVFFGNPLCNYWADRYGSKHINGISNHEDTLHFQVCKDSKVFLHLETEINHFTTKSCHRQVITFDPGAEDFEVVAYYTSMPRAKLENIPQTKLLASLGPPEVMLSYDRLTCLSYGAPQLLYNELDSYIKKTYGFTYGDPVNNMMISKLLKLKK